MTKSIFLPFVFVLSISLQGLNAQILGNGKNVAKLNLSSFVFKSIGLQYERQTGKKTTVALGLSFIPTSSFALQGQLEKVIDNKRVDVNLFKFGNVILTPEFRYYFSKKGAFNGFYVAPYARLGRYHIEGPVKYNTATDSVKTAVFGGNLTCISGGILLGSSFKLSNNIYLDWWILGASLGSASGTVSATIKLKPDEQESLLKSLNDTDLPLTSLNSEVNANGATVKSSGGIVGFRGFGINIGMRF